MAERVRDQYVALLIPDHRAVLGAIDATDSSYTQAGPVPGSPVPAGATDAVLVASGSQSAGGSLDVATNRPGYGGADGARVAWKTSAGAATSWYGLDAPQLLCGVDSPDFTSDASPNGARFPSIVALDNGTILVSVCENDATTSKVKTWSRAPSTGTWTGPVTVHSEAAQGANELHSALVVLPSGRVLLFHVHYPTATDAQVRMEYSDDSGATWEIGGRLLLPSPIVVATDVPIGISVAYSAGQMWMEITLGTSNDIRQYASDSLGGAWTLVETIALAGTPERAIVVGIPGGGFILTCDEDIASTDDTVVVLSAFQAASTGVAPVFSGSWVGVHRAFAVSDDGTIYLYGATAAGGVVVVAMSTDNGATFETMSDHFTSGTMFFGLANTLPIRIAAVWSRGRVVMACNATAATTTYNQSLYVLYLGGYSTLTMPPQVESSDYSAMVSWAQDWFPIVVPGSLGWTAAGAATAEALTSVGSDARLNLHTAAGNARTYAIDRATGTPTLPKGMMAHAIVSCQDDTGSTAALALNIDDTNDDFAIEVRLSETAIVLWDVNAGAQVATAVTTIDTYYEFVVALASADGNTGECSCWYRPWTTLGERAWTLLGSSTTITRAIGATSDYVCTWGHITAGAAESQWVLVSFTSGDGTGTQLATGQTNPDDLSGRPVGALPTYISDGVSISMEGGPTVLGDEWAIDARYQYPIGNLHPLTTRSPSKGWRSTSTADQVVVWQLDTVGACDWPSDLLGIWVMGTNASSVIVATESVPGAGYVTRATATLTRAVNYTRSGQSVEITATVDAPFSLVDDELVGCDFFDEDAAWATAREITRNTAGSVPGTAGSANRRPRLYCASMAGTENVAGDGRVGFPDALIIVQLAGVQPSSVKVTLGTAADHPVPSKGYIEADKIMVGYIQPLGWSPSDDRSRGQVPTVDVDESPGGQRRVLVRNKARRSVTMQWSGGVNEAPYHAGTDDFVLASDVAGAEPVAMVSDALALVSGLADHLDGPATPIVLIPRLPHLTAAATVLLTGRAGGCIYGSIVGDIRATTLLGDEEHNEVVRFAVDFDEEL